MGMEGTLVTFMGGGYQSRAGGHDEMPNAFMKTGVRRKACCKVQKQKQALELVCEDQGGMLNEEQLTATGHGSICACICFRTS